MSSESAQNEVTTGSGLKYVDLQEGQGAEAKPGQTVSVHYTGWLENGTKFDSSHDRRQPFSFSLGAGQVIRGWDEGVAGMKIGGKRKLTIPASRDADFRGGALGGAVGGAWGGGQSAAYTGRMSTGTSDSRPMASRRLGVSLPYLSRKALVAS
jgi:FKBP-type peptidyl-prolyl cis-trans isomerase FkpA